MTGQYTAEVKNEEKIGWTKRMLKYRRKRREREREREREEGVVQPGFKHESATRYKRSSNAFTMIKKK